MTRPRLVSCTVCSGRGSWEGLEDPQERYCLCANGRILQRLDDGATMRDVMFGIERAARAVYLTKSTPGSRAWALLGVALGERAPLDDESKALDRPCSSDPDASQGGG